MKHSDYITHIDNKEDEVYLRSKHFPVNMRLFKTSPEYKAIILQQCDYIRMLCSTEKDGYKKPHGMSSANAGLAFNIIGICMNRNTDQEFILIMINPKILEYSAEQVISDSNCGSLTLDKPIKVQRSERVLVTWYSEDGKRGEQWFSRERGSLTIQHEVDHNNGILITDKQVK